MPDLPPPLPAIELVLSTQGISKGVAQTEGPQLRLEGELSFGAIYIGAYAKNVDSSTADGEAAARVGMQTEMSGLNFAASAAWKRAIDPIIGSDADALEIQASASRTLGPITPKLSVTWSPDDLGSMEQTVFAEAGAAVALGGRVSASAAIGRRERTGGIDYTAWNAGLSFKAARPLTVDVRYYDSDGGAAYPYSPRAVVSGRLKF